MTSIHVYITCIMTSIHVYIVSCIIHIHFYIYICIHIYILYKCNYDYFIYYTMLLILCFGFDILYYIILYYIILYYSILYYIILFFFYSIILYYLIILYHIIWLHYTYIYIHNSCFIFVPRLLSHRPRLRELKSWARPR